MDLDYDEQETEPIIFLDIVAKYPPPYYIVAYTDVNSRLFALGTFTAEQAWNMVRANLENALSLPHFTNAMLEPVIIAPIEFPPAHQEWFEKYHMNWDLPLYHERAF